VSRLFETRLERLVKSGERAPLSGGRIGLEKESLRVSPDGHIARTRHPEALGSALTNPYITTDYSEALIEFRTPPAGDAREALEFLRHAHRFVYQRLDDELLWAASMPCIVGGEESIPIAWYGDSNLGFMKHVYRRGLGYRYGKMMQMIAGTHFNYSLPERFWPFYHELEGARLPLRAFIDDAYFGLARNLQRYGWLVPYLFGNSPAVCKSFFGSERAGFQEFDHSTWYEPHATSLRMSDIGYRNTAPAELVISYDGLQAYVDSLTKAITTPYPEYEKIGVFVDGEWRQLNPNYLQIEAEYYSSVRLKRLPEPLEKPSLALKRRGVEYVELRSVDVDVFEPTGANEDQLRFLEAFLLYCLLEASPRIDDSEQDAIGFNHGVAAHQGRAPGLELRRDGAPVTLERWAREILDAVSGVVDVLDHPLPEPRYARALARQREAVAHPEATPSARLLDEMRAAGEGFFHAAMRLSQRHRETLRAPGLARAEEARFREAAERSWAEQRAIEAHDDKPFEAFLREYFAQE